jgi:site-specific DNA-methyltransferase (adenine-specific)
VIQLIHGDCLVEMKKIPDKSIDLVLTDPPYNIGFSYSTYSDKLSDEKYINLIALFKGFKSCFIHYPEESMKYFIPSLGIPDEVMAWCYSSNIGKQFRLLNFFNCSPDKSKVKQPYKNINDKRVRSLIANGSLGTPLYDWFSDIELVKNVSLEKTLHPCPVPLKLMKRIIQMTTNKNDTILDPFMGSGTTGVACKELGRSFIGIEIDKTYFDIATNRINQTQESFL